MSRKQILAIIIIFFLAVFGTLAYLYFFTSAIVERTETGERTGDFGSFFPFGGDSGENIFTPSDEEFIGSDADGKVIPRLRMISGQPVAGFTTYSRLATSTPFAATSSTSTPPIISGVVYAERATGHIYESRNDTLSLARLSNTTIPKIKEASFATTTIAAYRFSEGEDIISTYIGKVDVATSTFKGSFLPQNIQSFVFSPSGSQMAYSAIVDGSINIIRSNIDGTSRARIFLSDITEWVLDWGAQTSLFITTKADSRFPGFMYSINPTNGVTTRILGDYMGLTTKSSPDGKKVLIGYTADRGISMGIHDIANNVTNPVYQKTLPEKCVWSKFDITKLYCAIPISLPDAAYPQDWYQGKVSFTDTLWKIDTLNESNTLVMGDQERVGNNLDIVDIRLSEDEKFLYFINKKDLTLWSYAL